MLSARGCFAPGPLVCGDADKTLPKPLFTPAAPGAPSSGDVGGSDVNAEIPIPLDE